MPRKFIQYIEGNNIYICKKCNTHLSNLNNLVSTAFRGQYGSAYLVNKVVNVVMGQPNNQHMTTGYHRVCDIFCSICNDRKHAIGWKYIKAAEAREKYKQGRFILEEQCIIKHNWVDS